MEVLRMENNLKQIIESELFTTEIFNKLDFIVVKQLDKITGITHKIVINHKELSTLKQIVLR
jgi:hypothetical protein